MYEYTGGKRRKCTPQIFLYLALIVFASLGICICIWAVRHMIT